jgi:hypothetical protein
MGQFVETVCRALPASAAIGQYLRVKLVAGQLALAGAADVEIGTMDAPAYVAGQSYAVRLRTAQGTCLMVAAVAIAAGVSVYADANGQVGVTGTNPLIGTSLAAASGAGSVIEVLRQQ